MMVHIRGSRESLLVVQDRDLTVLVQVRETFEALVLRAATGQGRAVTTARQLGFGTWGDFPLQRRAADRDGVVQPHPTAPSLSDTEDRTT